MEDYKRLIDRVSEKQDVKPVDFVKAAIKLMKLESETGKAFTELVKEFSEKRREIEDLGKKRDSLKTEINGLSCELKTLRQKRIQDEREYASVQKALTKSLKNRKRLERLGLEKVERLAEFVESYESFGYDAREVKELGDLKSVLREIQVDAATLENFIGEKSQMNEQLAKLREQIRVLRVQVEDLERTRFKVRREIEISKAVSEVLETRKIYVWCKRCGFALVIPLPSRWDLTYCNMMNMVYRFACNWCGFVNQMNPQEILQNIGWMILE